MNSSKSPIIAWGFTITGGILAIVNAALTFSFGSTYFSSAFGTGVMASYLAGAYALLIFDIGYLSWFAVHLRTAHGRPQRALSLAMAILSLLGSIMATVTMLTLNSANLIDLSAYDSGIGIIALLAMILATAAHIIAGAGFILSDPRERVKTEGANVLSDVIEDSLREMRVRLNADKDILIDHISADYRAEMLTALGFTNELEKAGTQKRLPVPDTQAHALPETHEPIPEVTPPPQQPTEPKIITIPEVVVNGNGKTVNFPQGKR